MLSGDFDLIPFCCCSRDGNGRLLLRLLLLLSFLQLSLLVVSVLVLFLCVCVLVLVVAVVDAAVVAFVLVLVRCLMCVFARVRPLDCMSIPWQENAISKSYCPIFINFPIHWSSIEFWFLDRAGCAIHVLDWGSVVALRWNPLIDSRVKRKRPQLGAGGSCWGTGNTQTYQATGRGYGHWTLEHVGTIYTYNYI